MKEDARYLGDGVYIKDDNTTLVMTTGAHYGSGQVVTNTIFLEPEVVHNLYRYLREYFKDV